MQRKVIHVVLGLLAAVAAGAQEESNDYYSNPEARDAVDKIVAAYGGREKLVGVERLAVTMEMTMGDRKMATTLYQTADKIRREVHAGQVFAQVFDGQNAFLIMQGRVAPAPPQVRQELQAQLDKGIGQASIVHKYLNPDAVVKYLGMQERAGAKYVVLETRDDRGQSVRHFFDDQTYREVVEVTYAADGPELQLFDSYKLHDGILYPEAATIRSPDGELLGGMRLVSISDAFEDDVFAVDGEE